MKKIFTYVFNKKIKIIKSKDLSKNKKKYNKYEGSDKLWLKKHTTE